MATTITTATSATASSATTAATPTTTTTTPPPTPARPGRRTKGTRWSSGESSRGSRGSQRGDRHSLNPLLELLHDKVITDLQEGGERALTGDPRMEVSVAVVEPTEDVEDQDTVLHGPAKVAKRVCHALHLTAEVADGEVALDEGPEAHIETQNSGLGVAQKLALERQPGRTRMWSVAKEAVEVHGDRPHNPRKDDAVESQPRGSRGRNHGVEEDVVVEGVAAESEEDQVPPAGVGRRLRFKDD